MDDYISKLLKTYNNRGEPHLLINEIYNETSNNFINNPNIIINNYVEIKIENTYYKIFRNSNAEYVYRIVQSKNGITTYFIISNDIFILFINIFLYFIFSSLISLTRSKLLKLKFKLFINK